MSEPIVEAENLKKKAANSLFWSGISSVIQQVLNLAFGIFLARLLSESDYGMVNLLAVFIGMAYLIQEGGFRVALINKKDATHEDYNSVFWTSFFIGVFLFLVLFILTPTLANFFNEPELIKLGRFQFLGFLIASLSTIPWAILTKNLKNKEIAKSTFIAIVISDTLGLILAINGFSYWGIASQSVCYVLVLTISMWFYCPWHPSFKISFKPVLKFLPFSIKLLISNIFTSINDNIFSFLLGKSYSKNIVGIYAQANKWTTLGQQTISTAIEGVAQPLLVKADNQQLKVFNKLMRFSVFLSFPCLLGFALISPEIIPIAIGDKWIPCISILQILCVWASFYPIYQLYTKQLLSCKKSGTLMWITIFKCLIQLLVVYFSLSHGLIYVAFGYVLVNILFLIIIHVFVSKQTGLTYLMVIKNIAPYLLITIVSLLGGYFVSSYFSNIYLKLLIKILITGVMYILLLKIFGSVMLKESLQYLKKLKK
ncbi:MAG: lipopolysaccharide biosynthesis protein [Bacteroidales bacterium]|nr:lipopolysaccharide biosynthesis protein [Bacteroidales bacterium]